LVMIKYYHVVVSKENFTFIKMGKAIPITINFDILKVYAIDLNFSTPILLFPLNFFLKIFFLLFEF